MGAVTVISSGKGGAGKSTTAVGLGRSLAKKGRRVLLVDCDAGLRTLDRMTGIEENLVFDSSDVAAGRCAPIEAIYPCAAFPGLFVMPAPARGQDMVGGGVMAKLSALLRRYYDHVIMDAPAGVGVGLRAAASGADRALLVCNPDPISVRGAASARAALDELGIGQKRLVINRFDNELFNRIHLLEDLDRVIDEAGVRLLGVVPEDPALAAAVFRGEDAPSAGMMAMARMAGRLEGERIPILLK